MTERHVRQLAEELARTLASDESLDPESKAALADLHDQVERALAGATREEEAGPSEHARGLVERFEDKHPELTVFVQRLADALMNAGL